MKKYAEHETTVTPWEVCRNPHDADYMEMRITSTIEGCPYSFSVVVKMTQLQMQASPGHGLGQLKTEQEMEAHALMWDRIFVIKTLLMSQPVQNWLMKDWLIAAPFLFTDAEGKPLGDEILNDEEMQKERDTWQ